MALKRSGNLPPPGTVIDIYLGPIVIGMMVQQFLLGIVCSYAVAYFRYHFSNDSPFCRSIATCLVICTVSSGILDFTSLYHSLVSDYGDYNKFDCQDWVVWMQPSFNAWISFIAHIFYIRRCWAVTRSLAICIFLGSLALSSLISGIGITIFSFSKGQLSNLPSYFTLGIVWSISATICNVGIAIVLVVHFWRRESVLRSSDAMISHLVWTTVETGLCTAILVVLNLVLFLAIPNKAYGWAMQFSFSHIYTITVLYTLIGRQRLRDILNEGSGTLVTEFQTSFLVAGVLSMSLLNDRLNRDAPRVRNKVLTVTHNRRLGAEQSWGEDNV